MKRREFMTLLGGAATASIAWPLAARAQQPAMPVIGFLNSVSAEGYAHFVRSFRRGLSETGYFDGTNVEIEYSWANGQNDRLPELAAGLIRRRVSVITANTLAAMTSKSATTTIPIVFVTAGDPVELGLVASLSRPGSNVTGVTTLNVEVGPKRLELLRELVPTASVMAVLVNPTNPSLAEPLRRDLQSAAHTLGLQLHVLEASSERDFDAVFAGLRDLRAGALVIGTDALFTNRREQLASLAIRHAVPAMYENREFAAAGGLMSYGGSFTEAYRQLGIYAGRILKGEKPANLPVQQATKIELTINLKTAKALGLTVPISLLGRADEVFE
jgi:putative ABC transport system substrate-binding protein